MRSSSGACSLLFGGALIMTPRRYDSVDETDQKLLKAKLKLAPFATWLREADSDSE